MLDRKDKYIRSHRQLRTVDEFKSLAWMEGQPVTLLAGNWQTKAPIRTVVLKDYQRTLLIEMQYERVAFRHLIPKAALASGDVRIKEISTIWKE